MITVKAETRALKRVVVKRHRSASRPIKARLSPIHAHGAQHRIVERLFTTNRR